MTNNLFDDFRQQQGVEKLAVDRNAAKFIFRGSMATTITLNGDEFKVGLVYNNREDEDKTYLYVLKPIMFENGSVFDWVDTNFQTHHYLIYDEEKSVKRTLYNKYLCFECNVQVDDLWGYISGPRSTYINTQLREMLYEVSLAKPVLIMGVDAHEIADVLMIGGRAWRIIEKDNYSAPGIVYYYLEQYVAQKDPDTTPETFKEDVVLEDNMVYPGDECTIATEDGYFESDVELQTLITLDSVTFFVPYDVKEFNVVYKTDGEVKTKTYKVVM